MQEYVMIDLQRHQKLILKQNAGDGYVGPHNWNFSLWVNEFHSRNRIRQLAPPSGLLHHLMAFDVDEVYPVVVLHQGSYRNLSSPRIDLQLLSLASFLKVMFPHGLHKGLVVVGNIDFRSFEHHIDNFVTEIQLIRDMFTGNLRNLYYFINSGSQQLLTAYVNVARIAFQTGKFRYIFLLEHDWCFIKSQISFTLPQIMDALDKDFSVSYMRFNQIRNRVNNWDYLMCNYRMGEIPVSRIQTWSNNPHIQRLSVIVPMLNLIRTDLGHVGAGGLENQMRKLCQTCVYAHRWNTNTSVFEHKCTANQNHTQMDCCGSVLYGAMDLPASVLHLNGKRYSGLHKHIGHTCQLDVFLEGN
eukprot:765956-Hanusia_phi.AAC.2